MTARWPARRTGAVVALLAAASVLAACAMPGGGVAPGMSQDDVAARWGEPRAAYDLPGGKRLFYSTQRDGSQLQALDFDADGRLLRVESVHTAQHLAAVAQGGQRAADVLRALGPPAKQTTQTSGADPSGKTAVWVYRFREFDRYRLAHIHFDAAGIAHEVVFADDPAAGDHYR